MNKFSLLLLLGAVAWAQKGNRSLVWEENFDGRSLDEKVWNFETGAGGWGNNERQEYTRSNHEVANGLLTITTRKEGEKYTSTRITTKGKKEFLYGYMEARAKLPKGHGIWPAFWMLGANVSEAGWPKCGEIDIMEYVGREKNMVYTTTHTPAHHGGDASSKKTEFDGIEQGFHVFGAEWDAAKISFFVDGQLVYTYGPKVKTPENWPFDQPEFFLLNTAVGGNFGGPEVDDSIFPQQYVIDYIRVYQ